MDDTENFPPVVLTENVFCGRPIFLQHPKGVKLARCVQRYSGQYINRYRRSVGPLMDSHFGAPLEYDSARSERDQT